MNIVERVALILLVAATPLTAQIRIEVPEEGLKWEFVGSFTQKPTVVKITYLPKPAEDDIVGGVHSPSEGQPNVPCVVGLRFLSASGRPG